jgi:homocysteine S-methyltransferase
MLFQIHRDYLTAGCDVISSATYQASVKGFCSKGFTPDDAHRAMRKVGDQVEFFCNVALILRVREWHWRANREISFGRIRGIEKAGMSSFSG